MRWNTTKTNRRHNFQYTKFPAIDLVFTDRGNISDTWPKSACGQSSSCRFSFSAARNSITKATEYLSVFFLYFGFLAFCLGKFESDTDFSGFESQYSKKISRNYLGLRMVKASPFIHQPDRVERKANDVSAAVWRYQKHVKKIWYFFHMCCYGFSQS